MTALATLFSVPVPNAGFAAFFVEEADRIHFHASVNGFAHVVDGEARNAYGGEGLHFHAGFSL